MPATDISGSMSVSSSPASSRATSPSLLTDLTSHASPASASSSSTSLSMSLSHLPSSHHVHQHAPSSSFASHPSPDNASSCARSHLTFDLCAAAPTSQSATDTAAAALTLDDDTSLPSLSASELSPATSMSLPVLPQTIASSSVTLAQTQAQLPNRQISAVLNHRARPLPKPKLRQPAFLNHAHTLATTATLPQTTIAKYVPLSPSSNPSRKRARDSSYTGPSVTKRVKVETSNVNAGNNTAAAKVPTPARKLHAGIGNNVKSETKLVKAVVKRGPEKTVKTDDTKGKKDTKQGKKDKAEKEQACVVCFKAKTKCCRRRPCTRYIIYSIQCMLELCWTLPDFDRFLLLYHVGLIDVIFIVVELPTFYVNFCAHF